jgi:hypothetical protein
VTPLFDAPVWVTRRAREAERVAGISNLCTVTRDDGSQYAVRIDIPTGLFKLLRETYGTNDLEGFSLYVDEHNSRWYFGVCDPEGDPLDLWYFTASNLPDWVHRR